MKNQLIKIILFLAVGTFSLTSCGSDKKVEKTEQIAKVEYYCPMKCEGEKTYPENVKCPTCGMDLVVIE